MAKREILIIIALFTLVYSSETDDYEYKKRGVAKATSVNTIPTGIQKPEYSYSIYTQNSNTQSSAPSQSYQAQVPNSFYPNQGSSQYYTSSTTNNDGTVTQSNSQVNLAPQQSSAQFVPLNFVPNPGLQAKYQIVPSKSANGNIQLAYLQSTPGIAASNLHLPQTAYSPSTNQINSQANPFVTSSSPHGHFNFATNYSPFSLGSPYLGQSPSFFLPQFNSPFYSNLLYSSHPGQNLYYPTNSQPKYTYTQSSQTTTRNEYDKSQGSSSQSSPKDDNDISAQSTELIRSDSIPGYKNTFNSGSAYTTKLK